MQRTLSALALVAAASAAAVSGQALSRPNDPPAVSADGATWFQMREPIVYAGNLYYPAGARVYFNGNTMTPVGTFAGVPLYVDTTVEPFSVVLVPLAGRLMQPYERRRTGDLAGTVGSSAPSFPIEQVPSTAGRAGFSGVSNIPQIQGPPVLEAPLARNVPQVLAPPAASPLLRDLPQVAPATAPPLAAAPAPVATTAPPAAAQAPRGTSGTLPVVARIWIDFDSRRWQPAGRAVSPDAGRFMQVGLHGGFPVYRDRQDTSGRTIYVASRHDGLLTPYRQID